VTRRMPCGFDDEFADRGFVRRREAELSRLRKIFRGHKRARRILHITVGTVETRMSISSPLMRTLMLPSLLQALFVDVHSLITLMREMSEACSV